MVSYELIRSPRKKCITIAVKPDGAVRVTAPPGVSLSQIQSFVDQKTAWIEACIARFEKENKEKTVISLNPQQIRQARNDAERLLKERCSFFAEQMGVTYGTIKVNRAARRWGSCNSKGNLNFTYRLLFVPAPLVDYIVVHELAHRKELNHSKRFWLVVEQTMPDYLLRRAALRQVERKTVIIETDQ